MGQINCSGHGCPICRDHDREPPPDAPRNWKWELEEDEFYGKCGGCGRENIAVIRCGKPGSEYDICERCRKEDGEKE